MTPQHFIIAGGQRCGSTYLYHLLDAHPEILMAKPLRPEPKYFMPGRSGGYSLKEYHELYFPEPQKARIMGEKSVSYFETPEAAKQIAQLLPECKILMILREPVTRALSNYWFTRQHGLEERSLETVFSLLHDRPVDEKAQHLSVSPYRYLERGLYYRWINLYAGFFKRNQIHLVLLEELAESHEALKQIYRFLNVDSNFMPENFGQKIMESGKPEETLSAQTLKLLQEYYQEPNRLLTAQYGVDLRRWRTEAAA